MKINVLPNNVENIASESEKLIINTAIMNILALLNAIVTNQATTFLQMTDVANILKIEHS